MPITPLHLGLMAPVRHFWPNRVSLGSFIAVNLWIDFEFIKAWLFYLPFPAHAWGSHSFLGALIAGLVISVLGVRLHRPYYPSLAWIYGAFLGGITHILLDMLVHPEMQPFYPLSGNPFYINWMEPLSWALVPLLGWLIVQIVSDTQGRIQRRLVDRSSRKP